jgi:2-polyprenyl-3-methyl-5-hydroxy-6-metoxy-1,4-benzoquinol methylase
MRCLDIGCGTNPKSCQLFKHDHITLADIDMEVLSYAHKQYPKCHVVRCSIDCLPFIESSFENVVCYHVLEHVKNPKKSLLEIRRVLTKQGMLYLAIPDGRSLHESLNVFFGKIGGAVYDHIWRYSMQDIQYLLKTCNFIVKRRRKIRFFRPLIAGFVLHLSIMLSKSTTKHSYIYREKVFSLKKRTLFNAILLVIERIDHLITRILPVIGAEIEIEAVKLVAY